MCIIWAEINICNLFCCGLRLLRAGTPPVIFGAYRCLAWGVIKGHWETMVTGLWWSGVDGGGLVINLVRPSLSPAFRVAVQMKEVGRNYFYLKRNRNIQW